MIRFSVRGLCSAAASTVRTFRRGRKLPAPGNFSAPKNSPPSLAQVCDRFAQFSLAPAEAFPLLTDAVAFAEDGAYFKSKSDFEELGENLVRSLENRYVSSTLEWQGIFSPNNSFIEDLVALPASHKLLLLSFRATAPATVQDHTKQNIWENLQPINMEDKEREKFLKGKEQVLSYGDVTATVVEKLGRSLFPVLLLSLKESFATAPDEEVPMIVAALAEASKIPWLLNPVERNQIGQVIARRILKMSPNSIEAGLVNLLSYKSFDSSQETARAYKRKIAPIAVKVINSCKPEQCELSDQRALPGLYGVRELDKPGWIACRVLQSRCIPLTQKLVNDVLLPLRRIKLSHEMLCQVVDSMVMAGVYDEALLRQYAQSKDLRVAARAVYSGKKAGLDFFEKEFKKEDVLKQLQAGRERDFCMEVLCGQIHDQPDMKPETTRESADKLRGYKEAIGKLKSIY